MIRSHALLANLPHIHSNRLMKTISCRSACGACCIAPSITSPIPGMPQGKPAGIPCIQLDENFGCRIFGRPERPTFCAGLQASEEMCGKNRIEALAWLTQLEYDTHP